MGNGQAQDGFGILQWMASFDVTPDRTTYNTLLNLLAQSARGGKARARHGLIVLERMRQVGWCMRCMCAILEGGAPCASCWTVIGGTSSALASLADFDSFQLLLLSPERNL
mgnify:CR=1 FL=1